MDGVNPGAFAVRVGNIVDWLNIRIQAREQAPAALDIVFTVSKQQHELGPSGQCGQKLLSGVMRYLARMPANAMRSNGSGLD